MKTFDVLTRGERAGVLLVLWLALFAGCATVTFKRGASPGAMTADERACRASNSDDADYVTCMRNRGWFVIANTEAEPGAPPATHRETDEPEPGVPPASRPKADEPEQPSRGGAPVAAGTEVAGRPPEVE